MSSFKGNFLFRQSVSKCSHVRRYWEVGFHCMNYGGHNSAHNKDLSDFKSATIKKSATINIFKDRQ